VEFVKHFGNRIFYGDATRLDLLQAAGIEQAQLLVVAVNSKASVELVEQVREKYPDLPIVARAVDRAHAYQLHALGVKYVIREYFASSVDAARETLTYLGLTEQQAAERAELFRQHDEQILKRAVEHRNDQEKLFTIARDGRAELEQLFNNDQVIRKKDRR
jgi:CPA2 family monovalent cation:H+ antiporter-2